VLIEFGQSAGKEFIAEGLLKVALAIEPEVRVR
jgi:hypothetical protein